MHGVADYRHPPTLRTLGTQDREALTVGKAHGDFEFATDRCDVALQRGHAHVVLAFDPRDVWAARRELGRDLLLGDVAAFA